MWKCARIWTHLLVENGPTQRGVGRAEWNLCAKALGRWYNRTYALSTRPARRFRTLREVSVFDKQVGPFWTSITNPVQAVGDPRQYLML